MELTTLTPSERVIDIVHPVTQEPLGIKVTLVSIEDGRLKRIKRKIQDERFRLEAKGKHLKSEDVEENSFLILHAAVTGWQWSGDATFNGEKPEYNLKNLKEVLGKLPWMRSQIEEAIADESAFFSV